MVTLKKKKNVSLIQQVLAFLAGHALAKFNAPVSNEFPSNCFRDYLTRWAFRSDEKYLELGRVQFARFYEIYQSLAKCINSTLTRGI